MHNYCLDQILYQFDCIKFWLGCTSAVPVLWLYQFWLGCSYRGPDPCYFSIRRVPKT